MGQTTGDTSDARGSAGSFTLSDLVSKLAPYFRFRAHPRVEQDLLKLQKFSRERHLSSVRSVIGDDFRLPTADGEKLLEDGLAAAPVVLFLGASGTGKSVVLKHFSENTPDGDLRLYFRADLSSVSPTHLESHLGLQHSLVDCLSEGMYKTVTLIIDQVDRLLKGEQIADVAQLLTATVGLRPRLKFVLGCQTAEAERALSRLSSALPQKDVARQIFEPDQEAIFQLVVETFPVLNNLAFRPELRYLLLRAKNLDLLVGRLDQLGELSGEGVTSQKQFIDWFWEKYVAEGTNGIARSTAMREVADLQADLLSPHVDPRAISDKAGLDHLRSVGLVAGDDQGITFQHDLYGDWARLRSIDAAKSDLLDFFLERGKNPLWLRAMRLWSAILLETDGAIAWKYTFDQFDGKGTVQWLLRDAMFDGLALAGGSYQYLTDLRPILFADKGVLLGRFLTRFLFSASAPDDLLARSFAGKDASTLVAYRAELRMPYWYLWGPVIRFIAENPDECRLLAPFLAVPLIQPWLQSIPSGVSVNKAIAKLAVAIAKDYLDAERLHLREQKQHDFRIFRCLFLAISEVPNEAEQLILQAIGLQGSDPYPGATVRNGIRYVNSGSNMLPEVSRVLGPFPVGPIARPSVRFREYILMGGGLREMYSRDQALARKVVLAAMIREPYLERPSYALSEPDRELAVANARLLYPSLYDNGLFSFIFDLDADWARDIIFTLVGFTSDRVEERLTESGSSDEGFFILIGDEERALKGDVGSYGWYRDGVGCPHLVVCALMALEKHLYAVIENTEDDSVIQKIVENLRDLSILGLLVSIGKKQPRLFQSTLRFMHFSEFVQFMDVQVVIKNEGHQMIAWTGKSDKEISKARQWHDMPHRKRFLKEYAIFAINLPEGREEAEVACANWAYLAAIAPDDQHRTALNSLIATYTAENYTFEQHEEGVLITCNTPEDVQAASQVSQERSERSIAPLVLTMRCRQILNGQEPVTDDLIHEMYQQCRKFDLDGFTGDSIVTEEDALAGVAAVLLIKFVHLIQASSEIDEWCRSTLVRICNNPPPRTNFDSDQSSLDNQWCHFAAQAYPLLWSTSPADRQTRAGMANLIEEGHYKTTGHLGRSLFEIRESHSDLYYQSVALIRQRAVETMHVQELERRSRYTGYEPPKVDWPDYPQLRAAFVEGTSAMTLSPLPKPITVLPNPQQRRNVNQHRDRARPLLDTHRLFYFAVNLPWQRPPSDNEARSEILTRWRELFEELMAEIRNNGAATQDRSSVHWYNAEGELFGYFGQFAVAFPEPGLMADWGRQIVGITPYAEHHAEQFVNGVFRRLLDADRPEPDLVENWLVLVELYLGTRNPKRDDWRQSLGRHDWEDWLVGNDSISRQFSWRDGHRSFVNGHMPIYESWCRARCKSDRSFRDVLAFLRLPACVDIIAPACIWFDEELKGQLPQGHGSEVSDALANFLVAARPHVSAVRRKSPAAFDSFLSLTTILNIGNNRLAMQLFDDVATLG